MLTQKILSVLFYLLMIITIIYFAYFTYNVGKNIIEGQRLYMYQEFIIGR